MEPCPLSEIAFTRDRFSEIMELLSSDGIKLNAMDVEPIRRRNTTWQRYEASREPASALVVLHTRWELPDHVVFIVSRDMRRIFRPSTWSTDTRLVKDLDARLLSSNGWYLGDGTG